MEAWASSAPWSRLTDLACIHGHVTQLVYFPSPRMPLVPALSAAPWSATFQKVNLPQLLHDFQDGLAGEASAYYSLSQSMSSAEDSGPGLPGCGQWESLGRELHGAIYELSGKDPGHGSNAWALCKTLLLREVWDSSAILQLVGWEKMTSSNHLCGPKPGQVASAEGGYQRYGVRSYLHQFYEDCTASIWEDEEDFQVQRSPNWWSSVLWKVGLISGTVFVILGLTVLAVGFLVPPKIEAFGEADFVVVDTHAVQFNGALDVCKLAGAVLFCIGGTSMAGCLLLSVFAKGSYSKEEKLLQRRFKERIADIKAHTQPITKAPGPGETKIPVTLSKVQNVQPVSAT
ncbi:neurensin-1 [Ctenodactylus gundi]